MKILVTAKRVTDPNAKLEIDSDGSWIEDDVEYIRDEISAFFHRDPAAEASR